MRFNVCIQQVLNLQSNLEKLGIKLVYLIPHSSHLTQPLDLGIYGIQKTFTNQQPKHIIFTTDGSYKENNHWCTKGINPEYNQYIRTSRNDPCFFFKRVMRMLGKMLSDTHC